MKKIKFLATLLAAGALVACNETIEPQGSGENTPTTGEGYVKVAINMPTTSGDMTKADSQNDDFNNGTSDEYAVGTDNWIIFFSQPNGTAENDATVVSATHLESLDLGSVNNDPSNVTTRTTAIIGEIPLTATHALVILNANSNISYSSSTLYIKNTKTQTFSDFTSALKTQELNDWIGTDKNSFLMANAPIATLSASDSGFPSGQTVTTLAKISVYPDEETAQSANPDQIYVERAVAKVTIANFPKVIDLSGVDENNPLNGSSITLTGWILDNTNTSINLVRNVTGSESTAAWNSWTSITNTSSSISTNRFFGTAGNPFRVYWALDDNYSTSDVTGIYSYNESTDTDKWNTAIGTSESPIAAYCFENTFPMTDNSAGNMVNEAVATRVLFRMTVTPNIKEDGSTVGAGETPATDFILFGGTSAVYTKTTFVNYIKEYAHVDVTLNTSLESGATFDAASELYGDNGLFATGVDSKNAQTILELLGEEVRFYKNNVMYTEAAYIKHFGEVYTPIIESIASPQSYLGRYGVVRNNWYELNVTKVGIGSPDIPDDSGDLDEDEAYMNVQINVLSWAKRSQDVDL